jgi:hypothetical protein
MPVAFDDYDPADGRLDLAPGTNARTIVDFLAAHPETGWAPKEIHEQTGVARGSVGPTLDRLHDHGLVRHKGDYWAIAADDRLGAYAAMAHGTDSEAAGDWYADAEGWADTLRDLDASGDQ